MLNSQKATKKADYTSAGLLNFIYSIVITVVPGRGLIFFFVIPDLIGDRYWFSDNTGTDSRLRGNDIMNAFSKEQIPQGRLPQTAVRGRSHQTRLPAEWSRT